MKGQNLDSSVYNWMQSLNSCSHNYSCEGRVSLKTSLLSPPVLMFSWRIPSLTSLVCHIMRLKCSCILLTWICLQHTLSCSWCMMQSSSYLYLAALQHWGRAGALHWDRSLESLRSIFPGIILLTGPVYSAFCGSVSHATPFSVQFYLWSVP